MSRPDSLERDLTAWLVDTATPRVPDFSADILWVTARTRQRPRWSFPERWLSTSVMSFSRRAIEPIPWRTLGLLAVLSLLGVAAVGIYVGSQPRQPLPAGLSSNGLVAYASGGDIYTVDPVTGARETLVAGAEDDREPRWSLDGTRIAFLRSVGTGEALVLFDVETRTIIATTGRLSGVDTDSIAWSPDGRSVAVHGSQDGTPGLYILDTNTGDLKRLAIDYLGLEPYWRPPDGRQIMFLGGKGPDAGLFMVDVDVGTVTAITGAAHRGEDIRPSGWTPDGQRVVFMSGFGESRFRTHVVDLTTGAEVTFEGVGFAHVSNDGSRMVALTEEERICVASLSGGPCVTIGQPSKAYVGTHAAGAQWSPDDEWVLVRHLSSDFDPYLIDPDGQSANQPAWIRDGAESIQRLAPD